MHRFATVKGMEISILQWNIWYKEDIRNIAEFLQTHKADIICLQELTINSKDQIIKNTPSFIAEQLGYNFYHKEIPIESTEGKPLMLANGIFSHFPVLDKKFVWTNEPKSSGGYDDEYRAYVEATLNIGGTEFSIGTTHMSYTHRFENTLNENREASLLMKQLEAHTKTFAFTGDLNALPCSHTISLVEGILKNAGPDYDKKSWATKPFSYNGFKESELNWRLDYVFTTADLDVISSEILNTKYSDHLPIFTKVKLPQNNSNLNGV
ncbi:hypothetical protein BH10PAT3_BH10PAT3_3310 [soil metagenome]